MGVGYTHSFNRYKIAHTLLWRNCTLYFETVLGMNKITPIVFPPLKNKKNFQKIFYFNNIFKNLFKGVGLATLSFNIYNMPQGFQRRSCFKYNEKTTPSPTPTFKKTKHSKKIFLRYIY